MLTVYRTPIGGQFGWGATLENLTSVPKGQLRWFSTPPLTVRGKAGLTWIGTITIDDAKAGPNEPTSLISGGGR